jgi:hypothetical protein
VLAGLVDRVRAGFGARAHDLVQGSLAEDQRGGGVDGIARRDGPAADGFEVDRAA